MSTSRAVPLPPSLAYAQPQPRLLRTTRPLFPESLVPSTTQRIYLLSLWALLQAFKLYDAVQDSPFMSKVPADQTSINLVWWKWLAIELFVLLGLMRVLAVPAMEGPRGPASILKAVFLVSVTNYVILGRWKWRIRLASFVPSFLSALTTYYLSTSEHRVRIMDVVNSHDHILGKHTVHILPHATVDINPLSTPFCLTLPHSNSRWPHPPSSIFPPSRSHIFHIPILVNNSIPYEVAYEIISLDQSSSNKNYTTRNINRVASNTKSSGDDYNDDFVFDEEDEEEGSFWSFFTSKKRSIQQQRTNSLLSSLELSPTQSIYTIPISISNPSVIKIYNVVDRSHSSLRVRKNGQHVFVVECPAASILPHKPHICKNDGQERISIRLRGTPPFSVRWHSVFTPHKDWVNRNTQFLTDLNPPHKNIHFLDSVSPLGFESPFLSNPTSRKLIFKDEFEDYSFATATTAHISLNISNSRIGAETFGLDQLIDALGNVLPFDILRAQAEEEERLSIASAVTDNKKKGKTTSVKVSVDDIEDLTTIEVHPHPQLAFAKRCANSLQKPVKLIKSKSAIMDLKVTSEEYDDTFVTEVEFFPPGTEQSETFPRDIMSASMVKPWIRPFRLEEGKASIEVNQEGTYQIKSVKGTWCPGEVKNPSICTVVEQPPPTAELEFRTINHSCAGEIGFRAFFSFSGTPPFVVHYDIREKDMSGTQKIINMMQIFHHVREEKEFIPEKDGMFEYVFKTLDDADYKGISLNNTSMAQHVKPLASAKFKRGKETRLRVCGDSKEIEVDIQFTGKAPYVLEYSIANQKSEKTEKINSDTYILKVSIPRRVAKSGGSFVLALVSVTDERECRQELSATQLSIEVLKSSPSVGFYTGIDGKRATTIRLQESVKLPLRLTGEGPWSVTYQLEASKQVATTLVKSANDNIVVNEPGIWKLIDVKDAFCPGKVIEKESDFLVELLAQPKLELIASRSHFDSGRKTFIQEAVCVGVEDTTQISLNGSAPFTVQYIYISPADVKVSKSFQTIQDFATIFLETDQAGLNTYEFTGISDFIYPQVSSSGIIMQPGTNSLRLEQTVYPLPSALLVRPDNALFCVHDRLASSKKHPLQLKMDGEPPFNVEIELLEEGTNSRTKLFVLENIMEKEIEIDLDHVLDSSGRHILAVKSIRDKHCHMQFGSNSVSSPQITFEVSETASISPVQPQRDHCVGDKLEFVMQGSAPWTVVSQFNRKARHLNVKTPKLTRVAESPGLFEIISVSHRGECESEAVNLVKVIHDIPTVKVSAGKNWIEDIHEGDQTEILFEFTGEPPFTFTYNRLSPQDRSRDKTVLESHTVSGINTYSYSIYTAQEGTWVVSYIRDRNCAFPPTLSPADAEEGAINLK